MRAEQLPWDLVPGPHYAARDLKPRKKWVTVGGWCLVVALLCGGLATRYYVLLVFSVLYTLTLLMKKDVVVTTRGLEFHYQMWVTTQYNFWSWDQIVSVTREDKNHPEVVALYFGMDNKAKRLYFTRPIAEEVLKLAKKVKPGITIQEAEDKISSSRTANRAKRSK